METAATLTPYQDALRYLENAKETLRKAGKKDDRYEDVKYVKAASGIAYSGVLLALDEYLRRKEGNKYTKPKSIEAYQARLAKQDKKLLSLLDAAYDDLHIVGYYHGTRSVKTIQSGLTMAKAIMEYIAD